MEVADPTGATTVGPAMAVDPALTNGQEDLFANNSLGDDDRSSSLSDIDEHMDHDQLDDSSPISQKLPAEIDSEAETERIDDSPNAVRTRKDIVLSAGGYENSPSKLAQSTTYDEMDVDDGVTLTEDSPSKPPRSTKSNGIVASEKESTPVEADDNLSASLESAGTKRKRLEAGEDTIMASGDDDEPARKRRASVTNSRPGDEGEGEEASMPPDVADELPETNGPSHDGTPAADEAQDNEVRPAPAKGRKGKKGKRKGKKTKDLDEDQEAGVDRGSRAASDERPADDDAGEVENNAKVEEEYVKKTSAMDTLVSLEKQFANLRDRVYDERIAKINNELAQLTAPTPTHPEYLRQLQCVEQHRDQKINYEETLFGYKRKSLFIKSTAERSQIHSTYFQRVRDVREGHLENVAEHFYRNQHDRFKAENNTPHYALPFPTRRSQQISQQIAYNKEVSVLAGTAKYVGFPAAPSLQPARPHEIDEDFEKMGISTQTPVATTQPTSLSRGPFISSQSAGSRPGGQAEEEFLEQTPWANPQHPVHQQHLQQIQQHTLSDQPRATSFTTPAAQRRAVDVNAPNGSASTIPENMSNANSSAANTPYGTEQERARFLSHVSASGGDPYHHADSEGADRNSGFRSQTSSPLDVRKSNPSNSNPLSRPASLSRPHESRLDGPSAPKNSTPSSSRLGLFNNSPTKQERSPQLPASNSDALSSRQRSSPLASMHQSAGIAAGASRMAAR